MDIRLARFDQSGYRARCAACGKDIGGVWRGRDGFWYSANDDEPTPLVPSDTLEAAAALLGNVIGVIPGDHNGS